jgi:hypothetical protein
MMDSIVELTKSLSEIPAPSRSPPRPLPLPTLPEGGFYYPPFGRVGLSGPGRGFQIGSYFRFVRSPCDILVRAIIPSPVTFGNLY